MIRNHASIARISGCRWLLIPILVALLAPIGCASSKKQPQVIYYRGAPSNVKEFTVGGLRVILRQTDPGSQVVSAKLFIDGGLAAIPQGVSPAVQQLALQLPPLSGPGGMTKEEYRRVLDRLNSGIVPGDDRDYSVMTLRCVLENFDKSWDLFTGVIMRPKIDPVEFQNAKERLVIGLRNRFNSPEAYANYLADSAFYHGHPYGRFAQEPDVAPITEKMLLDYYKSMFVKSRVFLVVVGNIDSASLHHRVASSFGELPQGTYIARAVPPPQNATKQTLIVRPPYGGGRAVTSYMVARYLAPNRGDSLYFPMMRLTSFLAGHMFREVRVQRNLSYAPDAEIEFGRSSYGQLTVSTTLPDSTWRVAKGDVVDLFREIVISEQSIRNGLVGWLTSNYMRQQTAESQANEMGIAELYTGSWKNAFRTLDAIRAIKPAQMNLAARRYLRNFTIVIVGNPSEIDKSNYRQTAEDASEEIDLSPEG